MPNKDYWSIFNFFWKSCPEIVAKKKKEESGDAFQLPEWVADGSMVQRLLRKKMPDNLLFWRRNYNKIVFFFFYNFILGSIYIISPGALIVMMRHNKCSKAGHTLFRIFTHSRSTHSKITKTWSMQFWITRAMHVTHGSNKETQQLNKICSWSFWEMWQCIWAKSPCIYNKDI